MLELRINNAFVINNMVEEGLNVGKPIKNLKNWILGVVTTVKAKRNYQREGSMA